MNITVPAPAKINLFLHITGRRPDGYHTLQTLFQFLDYGDELTFEAANNSEIHISCNDQSINDQNNLVYKVAIALKHYAENPHGVHIHLQKKIPIGAGLGGGSSDAATALLVLNRIWNIHLSIDELMKIGVKLGADIPVFIKGVSAFGEGIGEQLIPFNPPEYYYLVVIPPATINTQELYQDPQLPRNTSTIRLTDFCFENTHNDFEMVVCNRNPVIAKGLSWLKHHAPARLTGSGSCFFGCFLDQKKAEMALQMLPQPYRGFIANGCNVSPLHLALDQLG